MEGHVQRSDKAHSMATTMFACPSVGGDLTASVYRTTLLPFAEPAVSSNTRAANVLQIVRV